MTLLSRLVLTIDVLHDLSILKRKAIWTRTFCPFLKSTAKKLTKRCVLSKRKSNLLPSTEQGNSFRISISLSLELDGIVVKPVAKGPFYLKIEKNDVFLIRCNCDDYWLAIAYFTGVIAKTEKWYLCFLPWHLRSSTLVTCRPTLASLITVIKRTRYIGKISTNHALIRR